MSVKVRFAPSPTGRLHVGNVRAALLNWLFARQRGGQFLLRIDDTDTARSRDEYVAAIKEDLSWLGIDWDEEVRQSDRFDRYKAAAERLKSAGRLYPCYETAEELEIKRRMQRARGLPPVYDRAALKLSDEARARYEAEGRRPHWRFKLDTQARVAWRDLIRGEQEVDMASLSDPVLVRADGSFLYMLPSTVDDIDFAVTHVIRGEDHIANSGQQIQIFRALGAEPPKMAHYPLFRAKEGAAFSKRTGTGSVQALREEAGLEPQTIVSFVARLGTADPIEPFADPQQPLIESFDFSRFSKSAVTFDPGELDRLNAKIVHQLPWEQVKDRVELEHADQAFWEAVRPNIERLEEAAEWRRIVAGPIAPEIAGEDRDYCRRAADALPGTVGADVWKRWTDALKTETGRKGKALFLPLRKALTGQPHGPEMAALLPLIEVETARRRLRGETA